MEEDKKRKKDGEKMFKEQKNANKQKTIYQKRKTEINELKAREAQRRIQFDDNYVKILQQEQQLRAKWDENYKKNEI